MLRRDKNLVHLALRTTRPRPPIPQGRDSVLHALCRIRERERVVQHTVRIWCKRSRRAVRWEGLQSMAPCCAAQCSVLRECGCSRGYQLTRHPCAYDWVARTTHIHSCT